MRANIRWVSSSEDIFRVRIASAACNAVAKSSSCGAKAGSLAGGKGLAAGEAVLFWPRIPAGIALAASTSGTAARKSRRFISGIINDKPRGSITHKLRPPTTLVTLIALQNTRTLIAKLKDALPEAAVLVGGYAARLGPDLWNILGADASAGDAISEM